MSYDKPNINLLEETLRAIEQSGHSPNDVHHVVVKNKEKEFFHKDPSIAISWEDFEKISAKFNYYNGYGCEVVWFGCKVVFNDKSYLKRSEYDGSEWWSFIALPNMDVTIEKYDPKEMSINDIESEEDIARFTKKQIRLEKEKEEKVIKEKLDTKAFTLQDFIK